MNRRGRAGQVVDLVDLEKSGSVTSCRRTSKLVAVEQVLDVLSATGEEVVQADDVVALCEEPFAEMGADEPGAAGHEDAHGPDRVSRVDAEAIVCALGRAPGSTVKAKQQYRQ